MGTRDRAENTLGGERREYSSGVHAVGAQVVASREGRRSQHPRRVSCLSACLCWSLSSSSVFVCIVWAMGDNRVACGWDATTEGPKTQTVRPQYDGAPLFAS